MVDQNRGPNGGLELGAGRGAGSGLLKGSPMLAGVFPRLEPPLLLAWEEFHWQAVDEAPEGGRLWFWESARPFVVVGYGQSVEREVDLGMAGRLGVPVLRRLSGGGAVVQGPGILSYGLALPIRFDPSLVGISSANAWILERQRRALALVIGKHVALAGHTDLVVDGRKVSGNAQRRGRRAILFHGTFLLGADVGLMESILRQPSMEPAYRGGRSHGRFVENLGCDAGDLMEAVRLEWRVSGAWEAPDLGWVGDACVERYGSQAWNRRR